MAEHTHEDKWGQSSGFDEPKGKEDDWTVDFGDNKSNDSGYNEFG